VVRGFVEKPKGDGNSINGGFFILNPEVLEFIEGDLVAFEDEPLKKLAASDQLRAYHHHGFWQPMDTLRDRNSLNELWLKNEAPWRIWD